VPKGQVRFCGDTIRTRLGATRPAGFRPPIRGQRPVPSLSKIPVKGSGSGRGGVMEVPSTSKARLHPSIPSGDSAYPWRCAPIMSAIPQYRDPGVKDHPLVQGRNLRQIGAPKKGLVPVFRGRTIAKSKDMMDGHGKSQYGAVSMSLETLQRGPGFSPGK